MQNSKIEWCHHSFNPWIGCIKVSPGCFNCYAMDLDNRKLWDGVTHWGPTAPRRMQSEAYWRQPLTWDRQAAQAGQRHRVFCASMADVFEDHPDVVEARARLWDLVKQTPNLDWLMLTKRPENFARFLPPDWGNGYDNVWLMVSVENQETAQERIPILQATPALVRGLSVEPLIGPVDLAGLLDGIDWVIVGGESGPKARPMDLNWARAVVEAAQAAGVATFVKQMGSFWARGKGKGNEPAWWPSELRIRQFPMQLPIPAMGQVG